MVESVSSGQAGTGGVVVKESAESTSTLCAVNSASTLCALNSAPSRRSPSRFALRRHSSHRNERKQRSDSLFYVVILLGQLFCGPVTLPTSGFHLKMASTSAKSDFCTSSSSVRRLFDPMVGEFCADVSLSSLTSFFSPKTRWRDDAELARFAYQHEEMNSAPFQVNMMLTESALRSAGAQPSDPSLLDYDAIDQSWRRDIEQEKGVLMDIYPPPALGQGCSSSAALFLDPSTDQFQRDLQILTEKSLFATLSDEEAYRYENLSKAQYADFYRTVPNAAQKSRSECRHNSSFESSALEWLSSNEMKSALSDLTESTELLTSLDKFDQTNAPLHTYNNLTLCQDQSGLVNDVTLAVSNEVSTEVSNEVQPSRNDTFESLPEEFRDLSTLNLPDLEAMQLLNDQVVRSDLENSFWLHEFEGMEMLGEFQNYFVEDEVEEKKSEPSVPYATEFEEVKNYYSAERDTSPSSGIGSMRSSGSSPSLVDESNLSDSENTHNFLATRVYNKLAPLVVRQTHWSVSSESSSSVHSLKGVPQRRRLDVSSFRTISRPLCTQNGGVQQRKRGRQSKDEQLAMENALPASADEFAAMTHMEIQKYMRDPALSSAQKALIKKIRRRGRNKVAARKCRERRVIPESPTPSAPRLLERSTHLLHNPADLSLFDL